MHNILPKTAQYSYLPTTHFCSKDDLRSYAEHTSLEILLYYWDIMFFNHNGLF